MDKEPFQNRQSDPTRRGCWLCAELDLAGELVVVDHTADITTCAEVTGGRIIGLRVTDLLAGISPAAVSQRLLEIARHGGHAFYPCCHLSSGPGARSFSLECRGGGPSSIILAYGQAIEGLPWSGEGEALRVMLDRLPWSMQVFDRGGHARWINAAFERAAGLTSADLGEYNILYDPAFRREDLANLIDRVFAGEMVRFDLLAGSAARFPLELFAEGHRLFFPAWAFPIFGARGEVAGIVLTYEDRGEERGPADYLADERAFATEVVNAADALIICLDAEGRITLFNPKCESTSGWKKEEVLGSILWETMVPARYAEKIRARITSTIDDNSAAQTRMQTPWLTKDGNERSIAWHTTYHRGPAGKVERVTLVGLDITDQIHIENRLRESEERYRSVTEYSLTGIFIYQDDRFVYCNNRMETILGLHRDKIIGRPVWAFAHPDDQAMIRDRAKRRQRGDLSLPTHYSFRVVNSAGETRWLEMIVTSMDYRGRTAILGNVVDITERKKAESERDSLRRRLEQTQKMEALATLVGGIAHDFNNLLVGIMAGASDVLSQTEPDDPRFKPLGEILQTSRRAKDLISQMLTVGSRGPAAMVSLDLNQSVREALRLLRPTLPETIEVRTSLSEQPALVMGDRSQLWQVITNLCLNARDAMPNGGLLEIKTLVTPAETEGPGEVEVSVADTGWGIPAEIKDRIFEPFFTTKERGLGIGLGLAVVYSAVTNHQGKIEISDRPGGGTVFHIRLERAQSREEPVSKPIPYDGQSHHRLLIVDDEDGIRQVVARILNRGGHVVFTASDADETLKILQTDDGKLDLVILDLEMPGTSGAEIFQSIKNEYPDLKILLSSGQAPGTVARQLMAQGAVGFLQKPYDLWELRRAVNDALVQSS